MRRFVLTLAALTLIVSVVFLAFFAASDFVQDDQSLLASLSDFTFMIGTYASRAFGLDAPSLTSGRYERVMSHAKQSADSEVGRAVFWALERWGADVEPRLVDEIDAWRSRGRVRAAVTVLARRGNPAALRALERLMSGTTDRWLAVRVIEALPALGPAAAPALIDAFEHYRTNGLPPPYTLLAAIAETGGGTDFLLEQLSRATTADEILALQWPLAGTKDARAARALFQLMHHDSLDVRRRSRDSMSQWMDDACVEPAMDFLQTETDDYLRSWVIQSILADRRSRSSSRVVHYLGSLLNDPILAWEAKYALSRIGSEEAIAVLLEETRLKPAGFAISDMEYAGRTGLRVLEEYSRHEDDWVRRQVLLKLEELENHQAAPIYEAMLADPDPLNRAIATQLAFETDRLVAAESFRQWLEELSGERMGTIRSPIRSETRTPLTLLRYLHWTGLVVSALVGFLLLTGALRAFEPYKFALVLQFLIVSGLVGDFFLVDGPRAYLAATAARLVLLLGLMFLRDDPLPGEVQGRVERFASRALLLLAPSLALLAVPAFTDALRTALLDFGFVKWLALLLLLLTLLILEQAIVPWDLFPRGSRVERGMTVAVTGAIVWLFVVALWRAPSSDDRTVLNALFTFALFGALVFHGRSLRVLGRLSHASTLPPAPGRIRVVRDRESVLVKLKRRRSLRGVPWIALFGAALWFVTAKLGVGQGGGAAMVLLMLASVFGLVVAWLVRAMVAPKWTIQIRDGAARSGSSLLGGVIGRARWSRRLRLPALVGEVDLTPSEKRWLARVLDAA